MSGVSHIQSTVTRWTVYNSEQNQQKAPDSGTAAKLSPLGDRLVTGISRGAVVAAPVGLVAGAGLGAVSALFAGGLGSTLARGTGFGALMIGVPIAAAGAASGAAAAALHRGPAAGAAVGMAVGAASAVAAGALLDLGVHQMKPSFLVAGAAMGGVAGLVAARAVKH